MTLKQLKSEAARMGYILRRVGHKREKRQNYKPDGTPVRDCYIPHIPCDARTFAHTHRTLGTVRKWAELVEARALPTYADVWPYVLAVLDEKNKMMSAVFKEGPSHAQKHH